jgi:hypothetical protein
MKLIPITLEQIDELYAQGYGFEVHLFAKQDADEALDMYLYQADGAPRAAVIAWSASCKPQADAWLLLEQQGGRLN